jgi:cytochrome P450
MEDRLPHERGTRSSVNGGRVNAENGDIDDDLFAPAPIRDPYGYFGRLREADPVHWNPTHELWLVTRYDDAVWVTEQRALFSNMVFACDPRGPYPAIDAQDHHLYEYVRRFFSQWFVQLDPPAHTQMRKAIAAKFSAKAMENWRTTVRDLVEDLLDQAERRDTFDLVSEFATPMPLTVIAQILGLPQGDLRYVQQELGPALLFMSRGEGDRMQRLVEGIRKLQDYLGDAVAARAAAPGDDVLSALVSAERRGIYSREQVIANAVLFLVAGYDTTSSLITNGVLALLDHPQQWELMRDSNAQYARLATEEVLRFDSPQKTIQRIAMGDVELRSKCIRRFDRIRIVISSANRDPEKFADPDRFDMSRSPNAHLSYGSGAHHCIGAPLARLQTQEALAALARRYSRIHLEEESLEYQPSISFRSIKRMRVSCERG